MKDAILTLLVATGIALSISSCKPTGDEFDVEIPIITVLETAPTVTSAEVCGATSDRVFEVAADGELSVIVRYSDDTQLSQLKFDIHSNFDCHGHGRLSNQNVWQEIETMDIEGKEVLLEKVFTPPSNVRPGSYHFGLLCVDEQGNTAEPVYYDLQVFNEADTIPPTIILDSPNSSDNYAKTDPLVISGSVIDETEMALGEIEVSVIDAAGAEFNIVRNGFGPDSATEAPFQFEFNIPSVFVSGNCTIIITATDGLNNETVLSRDFTVTD